MTNKKYLVKLGDRKFKVSAKDEQSAAIKVVNKLKAQDGQLEQNGWTLIKELQETSGRTHAIIKRKADYVAAAGFDRASGTWGQGYYGFTSATEAENFLRKQYKIRDSKVTDSNLSNAREEIKKFYPDAEITAMAKNGNNFLIVKNANSLGSGIKNFLTNLNKKYGMPQAGFGGASTYEVPIVNGEALLFIK